MAGRRLEDGEPGDTISRLVESWPELWASQWAERMVITGMLDGLDSQAVEGLVGRVRRLLDHIERHAPVSRKELAAKLFGSAHALDKEDKRTKLAGAVTRALQERERDFNSEGYVLWEKVGILQCRVSAPVLTWSLPVPAAGGSFLDEQIRSATAGGLPLHISLFALQKYRITVPARHAGPRRREPAARRSRRRTWHAKLRHHDERGSHHGGQDTTSAVARVRGLDLVSRRLR